MYDKRLCDTRLRERKKERKWQHLANGLNRDFELSKWLCVPFGWWWLLSFCSLSSTCRLFHDKRNGIMECRIQSPMIDISSVCCLRIHFGFGARLQWSKCMWSACHFRIRFKIRDKQKKMNEIDLKYSEIILTGNSYRRSVWATWAAASSFDAQTLLK